MLKSIAMIFSALFLVACTHEQVYNAVQQNQQLECSKLPQVRYEECMKDFEESYKDYERERQEILSTDQR
ncbi:MAG: hypothetical protein KDI33_19985 [Halioglobus sp.]|nr:hypothetical protein [Halioglobus sp.]